MRAMHNGNPIWLVVASRGRRIKRRCDTGFYLLPIVFHLNYG